MTLRSVPSSASWFLNQFGTNTETESAIGDLSEQYQRGGRNVFWYWRQVLSIVFGSLLRDIRGERRKFVIGLLHTWLVWGGIHFMAGLGLLMVFAANHPAALRPGITVTGLPILNLATEAPTSFATLLPIRILALIISLLTLAAVGRYCTRLASSNPRSQLLLFAFSYMVLAAGSAGTQAASMIWSFPKAAGVILFVSIVKIAFAISLILFGGLRGLPAPVAQTKR